jgi:hypothetical protein
MTQQERRKREYVDETEWRKRPRARDSQGRYIGTGPDSVRTDEQRQKRREREAAIKKQASDNRTRVARRTRTIERDLRNQISRQGRVITIDVDVTIGQIAAACVRIEAMRSVMSRGEVVDDERLAALINICQRGLGRIGLRPTLLDADRPSAGLSVARARWEQQAKNVREASNTSTGPPGDDRAPAAK